MACHDGLDAADGGWAARLARRLIIIAQRDQMTDTLEQVSALLHEAGETHHRVFPDRRRY
jgi:hypothetical protein